MLENSAEVLKGRSINSWLVPVLGRLIVISGLLVSALDSAIRHGGFTLTPLGIFGIALFITGLSLYFASRLTLGRFFSETVRIVPEHQLITRGPYRLIRHPIYLGEILFAISIPIIFASPFGFVIMLTLIPTLLYRIRFEEKVLVAKFGQEYLDYARKTKKLIPYIY